MKLLRPEPLPNNTRNKHQPQAHRSQPITRNSRRSRRFQPACSLGARRSSASSLGFLRGRHKARAGAAAPLRDPGLERPRRSGPRHHPCGHRPPGERWTATRRARTGCFFHRRLLLLLLLLLLPLLLLLRLLLLLLHMREPLSRVAPGGPAAARAPPRQT